MDTDVESEANTDEEANNITLKEAMTRENESFEVIHDIAIVDDEEINIDIEEGYKACSEYEHEEAFVEIERFCLSLN